MIRPVDAAMSMSIVPLAGWKGIKVRGGHPRGVGEKRASSAELITITSDHRYFVTVKVLGVSILCVEFACS